MVKTSSSELKMLAKQRLKGRYGLCLGVQLAVQAVLFAVVLIYIGAMVSLNMVHNSLFRGGSGIEITILLHGMALLAYVMIISLAGLLMPGVKKMYMNLCSDQPEGFSDLFYGFRNKPYKFLGYYFMMFLLGTVWGIPYGVVMVVAVITDFIPVMVVLLVLMYLLWLFGFLFTMLHLSQSLYILIESPDKKVFASFIKSAEMMRGNKRRLFYLCLSFFGMILLGWGSFGLGFLWIIPYIQCTMTQFYLDLKFNNETVSPDLYQHRIY